MNYPRDTKLLSSPLIPETCSYPRCPSKAKVTLYRVSPDRPPCPIGNYCHRCVKLRKAQIELAVKKNSGPRNFIPAPPFVKTLAPKKKKADIPFTVEAATAIQQHEDFIASTTPLTREEEARKRGYYKDPIGLWRKRE